MEIKRYHFFEMAGSIGGECADGNYVLYSDAEAALASAQEEIEGLRERVKELELDLGAIEVVLGKDKTELTKQIADLRGRLEGVENLVAYVKDYSYVIESFRGSHPKLYNAIQLICKQKEK